LYNLFVTIQLYSFCGLCGARNFFYREKGAVGNELACSFCNSPFIAHR